MGDLTGEYFARMAFIRAVKWLSKYDDIDEKPVSKMFLIQKQKAKKLKKKIEQKHSRL